MQSADPNKLPPKFRKLRIAWSVSWGLSCVLLVVLWVRSHFVIEGVGRASQTPIETSGFIFMSDNGTSCLLVTRRLLLAALRNYKDSMMVGCIGNGRGK